MEDKKVAGKLIHNVIMEGRHKMSISGVTDVGNFDEGRVTLDTDMGALCITGEGLHINKLSVESGDVEIEGSINSCSYSDGKAKSPGGFLTKLLK